MAIRESKSKSELKDGVDQRKKRLNDREEHMKKTVSEKKEIADVSRKLRYPLKDSVSDIKKSLSQAAKEVEREFKKQNEDLEQQHRKCKEAEGDFRDRTEMAKINAKETLTAEQKMRETREAKPILDQARKTSIDDAKFTEDHRAEQLRDRNRSIQNRNRMRSQLEGIQLKL